MLGKAGKSFKKQANMICFPQEVKEKRTRSGRASTGFVNGEAGVGNQMRELELSEAESHTGWYKAIEGRDCKTLIRLLRLNEGCALLQQTGKAGRTVLHVAAIQGSLELVHNVQHIFSSANVDPRFAKRLTDANDGRCAMNAAEIAVHVVGNTAVWEMIINLCDNGGFSIELPSPAWVNGYELTQEQVNRIERIINHVVEEEGYAGLIKSFEENVDYNFCSSDIYGHLFLVHHACSRVDDHENDSEQFIDDVIRRCREVSEEQVMELMQLRDFQGRTPLHVAVGVEPANGRDDLLKHLMSCLGSLGLYLGVRDGRGWTPLHLAATQPYSDIFPQLIHYVDISIGRARISQVVDEKYCTALHLAVLHNNPKFVEELLRRFEQLGYFDEYLNPLIRKISFDHFPTRDSEGWTSLSLSLLLGNVDLVELLLPKNYSQGTNDYGGSDWIKAATIFFAAALGNTEILRHLMNDSRFDPFERDSEGRTTLHYAVNGRIEPSNANKILTEELFLEPRRAYTYVCVADVPNVAWLDELRAASLPHEWRIEGEFWGRRGCINMLIQAGVDIWQTDNNGKIAIPGRHTTDDNFISWWQEKAAKETLDTRNNLNQGRNAISVIGALIATASYVGPLQPPLNYGLDPSLQVSPTSDNTGYAHVWDLPVRVFIVSNSLSFYLAIASIMLAVVPSLPMPQEALLNEVESGARKIMASSICVLLFSIVGIIVSYAAASIAVMPEHNVSLTYYPALIGGFACLVGIVLFINRVLRLVFPCKYRKSMNYLNRVFKITSFLCSYKKNCVLSIFSIDNFLISNPS